MTRMKINKIKTLADTKFLKLYDAEYTNKSGNIGHWSIASRKDLDTITKQVFQEAEEKIDAVIIVATHVEEKKLVVIKQFRVPLNDYVYELPAGLIDDGEGFEETVKRELMEETGLELINIDYKRTKNKAYVSTGMTDESVALVYCECCGSVSREHLEEDEDIEAMLLDRDEAISLIEGNNKIDIKAFLAIQNFISNK